MLEPIAIAHRYLGMSAIYEHIQQRQGPRFRKTEHRPASRADSRQKADAGMDRYVQDAAAVIGLAALALFVLANAP